MRATACPYSHAIDRFKHKRQQPKRALANQKAASHLPH